MKAYYHLNVGMLCATCSWACYPDPDRDYPKGHVPTEPCPTYWHCVNPKCPSMRVVFKVKPLEAEVVAEEVVQE